MKGKILFSALMLFALETPLLSYAATDAQPQQGTYVKDSVITTKIKAKLATEHFSSLTKIAVDTDKDGAVWLTGTAANQKDIDRAIAIAHATDGVSSVENQLRITPTE